MTITITNRNINGITIFGALFDDVTLEFGAAETWPAGAVLARNTTSGRYVRFNPGGSGGADVPLAILTQPVTATAAGNIPARPAIQGQFRLEDLVDSTGTAITAAAVVQLRDYALVPLSTNQITIQDNQ